MISKSSLTQIGIAFSSLLIPILYFIYIGRYGWSDTDDGFILGYSWRLINGELPYKDFVYVRPPLSPMLHAIWFYILPQEYVYAFSRFVVILQIWIYSLVVGWVICLKLFNSKGIHKYWFVISICGFLLSVSSFTPMPWHTVDGIFFATLGVWMLITFSGSFAAFIAGILIFLSCMTKQSFYPLSLFAVVYLISNKQFKRAAILFVAEIASCIFFWIIARHYGVDTEFFAQTTGVSSINDAVVAGFWQYIAVGGKFFIMVYLLHSVIKIYYERSQTLQPKNLIIFVFLICAVLSVLARVFFNKSWINYGSLGFSHVLFLFGVLYLAKNIFTKNDISSELGFALFLTISWCASISWGFSSPILFSVPLILGGYCYAKDFIVFSENDNKVIICCIAISTIFIMISSSLFPYRDPQARFSSNCNLSFIEKKLSFIVTAKDNCEKISEAKSISKSLSDSFVFLPAFTMAYFISNKPNPIQLDWPMQIEMGKKNIDISYRFKNFVRYAIVDKKEGIEFDIDGNFGVPFVRVVKLDWIKIYSGQYYDLYENPEFHGSV